MKKFKYNKPSLEELCKSFKIPTVDNYYVDGNTIRSGLRDNQIQNTSFLYDTHKAKCFVQHLKAKRIRISEVRICASGGNTFIEHLKTKAHITIQVPFKSIKTHKNTWYVWS